MKERESRDSAHAVQKCYSDVIARLPNGHYRDELIKFRTSQVVWKELRDNLPHEVSTQSNEKNKTKKDIPEQNLML